MLLSYRRYICISKKREDSRFQIFLISTLRKGGQGLSLRLLLEEAMQIPVIALNFSRQGVTRGLGHQDATLGWEKPYSSLVECLSAGFEMSVLPKGFCSSHFCPGVFVVPSSHNARSVPKILSPQKRIRYLIWRTSRKVFKPCFQFFSVT